MNGRKLREIFDSVKGDVYMSHREELHNMAVRLQDILQNEEPDLEKGELTALSMACQLLDWASKPPEQVRIVTKKSSITFGAIKLGGDDELR